MKLGPLLTLVVTMQLIGTIKLESAQFLSCPTRSCNLLWQTGRYDRRAKFEDNPTKVTNSKTVYFYRFHYIVSIQSIRVEHEVHFFSISFGVGLNEIVIGQCNKYTHVMKFKLVI